MHRWNESIWWPSIGSQSNSTTRRKRKNIQNILSTVRALYTEIPLLGDCKSANSSLGQISMLNGAHHHLNSRVYAFTTHYLGPSASDGRKHKHILAFSSIPGCSVHRIIIRRHCAPQSLLPLLLQLLPHCGKTPTTTSTSYPQRSIGTVLYHPASPSSPNLSLLLSVVLCNSNPYTVLLYTHFSTL